MDYRPDIDGLRALAVVSVVLCHAGVALPGGYVGVDVFFVISGYLITRLLLNETAAGRPSLMHFWERRIRRLLPALAVVVATCFVAGWFILVPPTYELFGRAVVNLSILKSNVFYANRVDYFAPSSGEMPLLHTWSLAVEEQFYLVAPVLFWCVVRYRRKWLGSAAFTVALASFAASAYGVYAGDTSAYYLLSTRSWELLAGAMTALHVSRPLTNSSVVREAAAILATACIAVPCLLYDERTPFPGAAALPPVFGTMVLLVLGGDGRAATRVHRLLSVRPARGVGLISYSFYLWHWPIIVFYRLHRVATPTMPERLLLVAASLVAAVASYRLVEQPFRRRSVLATRQRLFGGAAVTVAALFAAAEAVKHFDGMTGRLPPEALALPEASFAHYERRDVVEPGLPEHITILGTADAPPTFLIWGDSHAIALLPAVDEQCRARGVAGRCAAAFGRPPLIHNVAARSAEERTASAAMSAAVLEYVRRLGIRDVILAAYWERYAAQAQLSDELLATIDALRAAGCRVYFVKSVPTYPFNVRNELMRCIWKDRPPESLSLTVADYALNNSFQAAVLGELQRRDVAVLDPIPALLARSNSGRLVPYDDGGIFFGDSNHLTVYGAQAVMPAFEAFWTAVAPAPAAAVAAEPTARAPSIRR